MASKKEHMRKLKAKSRASGRSYPDHDDPAADDAAEGSDLNDLNLVSLTPKAEDDPDHAAAETDEDGEREERERETIARRRREAELEAEARRQADMAARQRQAREEAERARLEEEKEERARREAESRQEAEEAVRALKEAEQAERVRVQSQRLHIRMESTDSGGTTRRETEEIDRARRLAAAAEAARREADEAERQRRIAAVEEAASREAVAAERARLAAEAETEARRQAEGLERARDAEAARDRTDSAIQAFVGGAAPERARKMAEEAERARGVSESVRTLRDEEERAELAAADAGPQRAPEKENTEIRARNMAEAAERARAMAEKVERTRREAEGAERAFLAAEAAEKARREEEEAKRRLLAEAAERARFEMKAAEHERHEAERAADDGPVGAATQPAAALEVENPYWEKPSAVFDMLSGAFQGDAGGEAERADAAGAGALPATLAEEVNVVVRPEYDENREREIRESEAPRPDDCKTIPVPAEKRMYIVMVTPEVAPCAKVGGLGDVVLGLGRELVRRGHGVEIIAPMYSCMRYDLISDLHEEYGELWSPHYNSWRSEKVFQGKVEGGLQVNFITGGTYTERPSIYGFPDDMERFTYFSRQALEFMYKTNRRPDIIHCHDWATGLVPAIYWDIYQKMGWDNSRFIYTIHNNECQGLCGFGDKLLGLVGLDVKSYHRPDRMQDDTHRNCINMMKSGIVFSNFVTTVSPTYAGELKTNLGGRGLQQTIARQSAKVGGVLNGIDYDVWNPRTDQKISARYSDGADFAEKYRNKAALREWLGLYDAWRPLVSVVTRLTHQKGLDLIKHAIHSTLKLDGQFVLLGSAPDPKVNADFLRMQHELRDNKNVNLYIGYHEDLSHLIYAGSDMFLVPSLYEPCGLTQMISLRYGTVPIVRETGGLVDTVFDLDNSGRGLNNANGYTFRDPTPQSLDYGLGRAIRLWFDNPEAFNRLARNGMRYDYSWRYPTEHYENIYNYVKA